jgi:hypothetical protein
MSPRRGRSRHAGAARTASIRNAHWPGRCAVTAGAVIGVALEAAAGGAGFRKIARVLGRPASTVRGGCAGSGAGRGGVGVLHGAAGADSPDPVMPAGAAGPAAAAVSALAGAAEGVQRVSIAPSGPRTPAPAPPVPRQRTPGPAWAEPLGRHPDHRVRDALLGQERRVAALRLAGSCPVAFVRPELRPAAGQRDREEIPAGSHKAKMGLGRCCLGD